MPRYRYLHLDVFTDQALTGNQLAVLPDAAGLQPDVMQRIACEMAFSETTFVLPAESAGSDMRVRIFTPAAELPMAGHPTIGTAFALAHERVLVEPCATVVFGLGIGPTSVQLEWEASRLTFAWMTQPVPRFGARPSHLRDLADALGITEDDIQGSALPVQEVSSGVPWLMVPLASRRAVDALVFRRDAVQRVYEREGMEELPVFVFSLEPGPDDATAYSRMFAPAFGIPEDPATGGASGPLGGYLVHHGAVSEDQATRMVSVQGVKMGRPSRIHISIASHDGLIDSVRVGGQAVLIAEGTLHIG